MEFCGQCGAKLGPANRFCYACGAPVQAAPNVQRPQQPPRATYPTPMAQPPIAQRTSRKKWLYIVPGTILGLFILLAIIGSLLPPTPESATQSGPTSQASNVQPTPRPQKAIDRFPDVASYLSGDNNDSPSVPRLRSFQFNQATGTVTVNFNMNQNITDDLMRDGIKTDMSTIYTDIFHKSNVAVSTVHLTVWGPFQDQYGNTKYEPAYSTTLTSDIANRINWSLDEAVLNLNIIPGLWTVDYAQPSMGF